MSSFCSVKCRSQAKWALFPWPAASSAGPRYPVPPLSRKPLSLEQGLAPFPKKHATFPFQKEGQQLVCLQPITLVLLCQVKLEVRRSCGSSARSAPALRAQRPPAPHGPSEPLLCAGRGEASSGKPHNSFPGRSSPWTGSPGSQATSGVRPQLPHPRWILTAAASQCKGGGAGNKSESSCTSISTKFL